MKNLCHKYLSQVGAGVSPILWGSVLGVVGYTVANRNNFNVDAFLMAALGAGVTASLEFLGGLGMVLQVANVALTAETVNYLQNNNL